MSKMSERVRRLVGLENLLLKARRRQHECEREGGPGAGERAGQYALVVSRINEEIHSVDRSDLEEYLSHVETSLVPRISRRVEDAKDEMMQAAAQVVDGRHHLQELRTEYTDALERIRTLRERLGRDPFKPLDVRWGLGTPPPNSDRRTRDAHSLVKDHLKS